MGTRTHGDPNGRALKAGRPASRRGGSGGLAPRSAWALGWWSLLEVLHTPLLSTTPKWAACGGAEIVGPLFATGRCPISMDIHGHPWKCMEMYRYPLISMVFHGHPWISMDIHVICIFVVMIQIIEIRVRRGRVRRFKMATRAVQPKNVMNEGLEEGPASVQKSPTETLKKTIPTQTHQKMLFGLVWPTCLWEPSKIGSAGRSATYIAFWTR